MKRLAVAEFLSLKPVGKFPTGGLDHTLNEAKAYLHANPAAQRCVGVEGRSQICRHGEAVH